LIKNSWASDEKENSNERHRTENHLHAELDCKNHTLFDQVALHRSRAKSRRALRGLDQDRFNDIGVSQRQAEVEAKRPF